jgi:hypothetical protein
LTEADADNLRSLLDRYVGVSRDAAIRITFISGEVFVLRYLSEVDEPDEIGVFSGEILASENITPDRARFFTVGSGIDFAGSEIAELEDAETGELLFSRASRRL